MTSFPLQFDGAGYTHTGMVRDRNEDAILLDPSGQLWVISDGMGGHGHGDVAAAMVVDGLAALVGDTEPEAMLAEQIARINTDIHNIAARDGGTMGATLVAAFLQDNVSYLVWVGDSTPNKIRCLAGKPRPTCLLYTSPSPRDKRQSRMPSSA